MITKTLQLMDDLYESYLLGSINEKSLCNSMSSVFGSIVLGGSKRKFTTTVVNHSGTEKFFGIRVFPSPEALDKFCEDMTKQSELKTVPFTEILRNWRTIGEWYVEIDAIAFDRSRINFTPKELTAITLHEFGHIIESDKPVESFYRAYRDAKLRLNLAQRATQKIMYNIYMLPLSLACMQKRWTNEKNQVNNEFIADKTVMELGYGEHLMSALTKIIKAFGEVFVSDRQLEQEVESSVDWCNKNVADVMKRKESLKDELYYQAIKTKSNYVKAVGIIVLDKLGFKLRERFTGVATENTIELLCDPELMLKYAPMVYKPAALNFDRAYESIQMTYRPEVAMEAIFSSKKTAILPSNYEVDSISIEIDNIQNNYDRLFVLDLIYAVLEKVTNFEEAIAVDKRAVDKWASKINIMRSTLESMRKTVLEKRIPTKSTKYIVSYPAGYEG